MGGGEKEKKEQGRILVSFPAGRLFAPSGVCSVTGRFLAPTQAAVGLEGSGDIAPRVCVQTRGDRTRILFIFQATVSTTKSHSALRSIFIGQLWAYITCNQLA